MNDALDADSQRRIEKNGRGASFLQPFSAKIFFSPRPPSCFERSVSRDAIPRFHEERGERERERGMGVFVLAGSSPRLAKFTARKAIDFNSREANSSLSPSLSLCLGGRDRWYNGEGKGVAKWP